MESTPRTFDRTRDHWWWRPGWGPGSRYLTFHLTFEGANALHAAARQVAANLRGARAVDLVPTEWLHLTMTGVGFTTELGDRALETLTDTVFSWVRATKTDPLRFHRSFMYGEGFGIATRPAAWLDDLKAVQSDAVSTVRDVHNDSSFEPHVSLAYFSGDADVARVEHAARALPADDIVVEHPRLSLIELGREDRVYTWHVLRQLTLGG
jgi:2'-5' RNA ligase